MSPSSPHAAGTMPGGRGSADAGALAAGVVFSLLVHVSIMAVVVMSPSTGADGSEPMSPWNQADTDMANERDSIAGIEQSEAVTINWVGFETPSEHQAPESEVDQSAMSPAPGLPGATPTQQSTPAPPQATVSPAAANPRRAMIPVDPASDLLLRDRLAPDVALLAPENPVADGMPIARATQGTTTLEQMRRALSAANSVLDEAAADAQSDMNAAQAADADARENSEVHTESPSPEPAREVAETSASAPATQPSTSAGSDGAPGELSDSEADASSTTKSQRVRPGRVVAREGLEVFTRRPRFRHTVDLTAPYNNPIVRVFFDRQGVVRNAEFVREGTTLRNTGSVERDGPVLDAVYRWRASGADLDDLDPDDSAARVEFVVELLIR